MEKQNKEKLDILVVEDTPIHQEAARVLLKDHNLEIVSTFDEARAKILGHGAYCTIGISPEKNKYDAVLTDLYLPPGKGDCKNCSNTHWNQEVQPFGYPIAMMALKEKIPYVGIMSEIDHHRSVMAYALEHLNNQKGYPEYGLQEFGDSRLCTTTSTSFPGRETICGITTLPPENALKIGTYEEMEKYNFKTEEGILHFPSDVKDWKGLLDILVEG